MQDDQVPCCAMELLGEELEMVAALGEASPRASADAFALTAKRTGPS